MLRRALPVLLLAWAVVALGWALVRDDEVPTAAEVASEETAAGGGAGDLLRGARQEPALEGAGSAPAAVQGPDAPPWEGAAPRLEAGGSAERFFAWVREDPRRLLAFLRRRSGDWDGDRATAWRLRGWSLAFFAGHGEALRPYLGLLAEGLAAERPAELLVDALLGTLAAIHEPGPPPEPVDPSDLRFVVRAPGIAQHRAIAALAAGADGDPRVLEALAAMLGSAHARVRGVAREALLAGGPERLLACLGTPCEAARVECVDALWQRGVPGATLAPILLPALGSADLAVRDRAVGLLPRVGRDAREALPYVEALLQGDDVPRWLTGVQALGALGTVPGDKDAVLRLLAVAARLRDERVRTLAVQAMLAHDDRREAVVALLADLFRDTEVAVRREALDGLGELSAHDARAREQVRRALEDADESVRALARYWLDEDDDG